MTPEEAAKAEAESIATRWVPAHMTARQGMVDDIAAALVTGRRLVEKNDRERIVAESDLRRSLATAQAEQNRLKGELAEARENIERMKSRYDDVAADLRTIEKERNDFTKQRVDIGNAYDLFRASHKGRGCGRREEDAATPAEQAQQCPSANCQRDNGPHAAHPYGEPGTAEQAQGDAAPKCDRCSAPISSYSSSRSCSRCDTFWTEAYQAGRAFEREHGAVAALAKRVEALQKELSAPSMRVCFGPALNEPPPSPPPKAVGPHDFICKHHGQVTGFCEFWCECAVCNGIWHRKVPDAVCTRCDGYGCKMCEPDEYREDDQAASPPPPEAAGPAVQFTGTCRVCHELVSDGREVHRECEAARSGHAFVCRWNDGRHCNDWCKCVHCDVIKRDHAVPPITEGT